MAGVTFDAPGKVNLSLAVGPRNADGYHPLRSLMVTLDGLADRVSVSPAPDRRVVCAGADDPDNLAGRALDALETHTGRRLPCQVVIEKAVPDRAGLGGGSSDAAVTLRAANEVFGLGLPVEELERVAGRVASDVAFFVRGGAQWAEGRGERLTQTTAPSFVGVVLVPEFGLSTPRVYATFDRIDFQAPPFDGPFPEVTELEQVLRNDLWEAARASDPRMDEVAERLKSVGAARTLLCGSGSGVIGFFANHDDAGAAASVLRGHGFADRAIAVVSGPGPRLTS